MQYHRPPRPTRPPLDPRNAIGKMLPWAILIAILIAAAQWWLEKK
jgi:hypothetical protein